MESSTTFEILDSLRKDPAVGTILTVAIVVGGAQMLASGAAVVLDLLQKRVYVGDSIKARIKCPKCGDVDEFMLSKAGRQAQSRGATVAQAFPELSESRRQQLITHVCPKCQGVA